MIEFTEEDRAHVFEIVSNLEAEAIDEGGNSALEHNAAFLRLLAERPAGDAEEEPVWMTALARVWSPAMRDPGRYVDRHIHADEPIEDLVDWQWRALMAALDESSPAGDAEGLRKKLADEVHLRRAFVKQRDEAHAKLAKITRALGPEGAAADIGAARAVLADQAPSRAAGDAGLREWLTSDEAVEIGATALAKLQYQERTMNRATISDAVRAILAALADSTEGQS